MKAGVHLGFRPCLFIFLCKRALGIAEIAASASASAEHGHREKRSNCAGQCPVLSTAHNKYLG